MAKLFVIKSVEQEEVDKRKEVKEKLETLIRKYGQGNIRVDTSRFFPEEFTISKDNSEVARINLEHHTVGVVTASLPAWLIEAIAEIENGENVEFDVYLNNEKD